MGQRFTLSFSDIKMANEAYGCGGQFSPLSLLYWNNSMIFNLNQS